MLFCDTADATDAGFDSLLCFVSQLRAQGLPAAIHESSVPEGIHASQEFDLAPFLTYATPSAGDRAVLVAAEKMDATRQRHIRALWGRSSIPCLAYGSFPDHQARISAESRLAYALSRDPEIHDAQGGVGADPVGVPIFHSHVPSSPARASGPQLRAVLVLPPILEAGLDLQIRTLARTRGFDLEIITDGKSKAAWKGRQGSDLPVWRLGELTPRALAARYDVAIFFDAPMQWPRLQMFVANLAGKGAALIDATPERHWTKAAQEFIAGTPDLTTLGIWLQQEILESVPTIRAEMAVSSLVRHLSCPAALRALSPPPAILAARRVENDPKKCIFVPTNGVGLGHAKRCALIADEMRETHTPVFAAFPSCLGMLNRAGFDAMPLVGRTPLRSSHANDVINNTRVDALAKSAGGIVFDGGYVFDSVVRAAAENGLPSVWIRRGLWQASQNNDVALDRQKIFTSIVVPTEVFDELNAPPGGPGDETRVGPIVHRSEVTPDQASTLRQRLKSALGVTGERLVVTMLGGGVAADRKAQINAIASHLVQRQDVLHLVVTWPTAHVEPAWFQHANTRVVRTLHASGLVQAADLFVSAVGYNSFHEAIYGAVPTVFVPQMAGFMDDQRARGTAAAERDLAVLVEPWDLLTLTKTIDECLEGRAEDIRQRLKGVNLPATGTEAAAAHIREVVH